jgi:predicted flap endonuclease-1-like 5' DNA nuclease
MLLACCKQGDDETIADEFSIYPFELVRLRETFDRLLIAASAVSKYVFSDITADTEEKTANKPEPMRRLTLLHHMVTNTLPAETATLTLVKGIGPKWARTLRDRGFRDIDALTSAAVADLENIHGLSRKRIMEWILAAQAVASAGVPSTEHLAPLVDCELTDSGKRPHDPYRMRRALELTVMANGTADYIVSGGLEPHKVHQQADDWECDCMDFTKGNICKHILAVRSHCDVHLRKQNTRAEQSPASPGYLDLFNLWSES